VQEWTFDYKKKQSSDDVDAEFDAEKRGRGGEIDGYAKF
jgi:hypothetical protein